MPLSLAPADVPTLIPDAPTPGQAHVTLALIWARGELVRRRVDPEALTGDALIAARTALAAKALAYKAGLGGTLTLLASAGLTAASATKKVKLGPIEVELATKADTQGNAVIAGSDLDLFALQFLMLAYPASAPAFVFPGASR